MDVEAVWLAGLYEGEGTLIGPSKQGYWQLTLNMVDEDVVRRAHRVAGAGSVTFCRRGKPHWSDQWRFRVGAHRDIAALLERMRPWLGERRGARADEFLTWFHSGTRFQTSAEVRSAEAARLRAYRARKRAEREALPA